MASFRHPEQTGVPGLNFFLKAGPEQACNTERPLGCLPPESVRVYPHIHLGLMPVPAPADKRASGASLLQVAFAV